MVAGCTTRSFKPLRAHLFGSDIIASTNLVCTSDKPTGRLTILHKTTLLIFILLCIIYLVKHSFHNDEIMMKAHPLFEPNLR